MRPPQMQTTEEQVLTWRRCCDVLRPFCIHFLLVLHSGKDSQNIAYTIKISQHRWSTTSVSKWRRANIIEVYTHTLRTSVHAVAPWRHFRLRLSRGNPETRWRHHHCCFWWPTDIAVAWWRLPDCASAPGSCSSRRSPDTLRRRRETKQHNTSGHDASAQKYAPYIHTSMHMHGI